MKIRIIHDKVNNIPDITKVYKDEFSLIFYCKDEYGDDHGVNHDSAVMNFSYLGTDDEILTKTASIQGSRLTFTFSSTDFDKSAKYLYQVIINENSVNYCIAQGKLILLPYIE